MKGPVPLTQSAPMSNSLAPKISHAQMCCGQQCSTLKAGKLLQILVCRGSRCLSGWPLLPSTGEHWGLRTARHSLDLAEHYITLEHWSCCECSAALQATAVPAQHPQIAAWTAHQAIGPGAIRERASTHTFTAAACRASATMARPGPTSRGQLMLMVLMSALLAPCLAQQGIPFTYLSYRATGSGPTDASQVRTCQASGAGVSSLREVAHSAQHADGGRSAASGQQHICHRALGEPTGAGQQLHELQPSG